MVQMSRALFFGYLELLNEICGELFSALQLTEGCHLSGACPTWGMGDARPLNAERNGVVVKRPHPREHPFDV
jgi:hypothetical protein